MNVTPAIFAQSLLTRLSLPVTDNNVAALVAFQAREGGHMHNGAAFNPMNTTMPMPGSHMMPGSTANVQAYTSWDQGLDATAKTLTNGLYKGILTSLQQSAHPDVTLKAVAASPWGCTICGDSSASNFQYYRDSVFPSIAPDFFGIGRFTPAIPNFKAVLAVGAVALGAMLIIGYVAKPRKSQPARSYRVLRSA